MKERVELNNNGQSIESNCKHFEKKKWESRYIVCKKQSDLESPVFMIFKQKKDRQKDKVKQSIVLQNYIGFEKSFPLKNKNQTLTIITKDYNIVLSFQLPETLLQWETWFKNVGGQCTTHYMQLLKFPSQKDNGKVMNKEVRCHLHDGCLALVHSIPAVTLLYCEISAANITIDEPNFKVTIKPHHISDEEFVLCCPSIKQFAKFKSMCDEGSLNRLLKKQQEGVWMTNIRNELRAQDSMSHLSDTFSGMFNFMNIPSTSANPSELFSSRLNINWKTTPKKTRNNSIIEQPLADYMNTVNGVENTDPEPNNKRSTSLPEYVNIQIRQPSKELYHEMIQRKASTMTSPNETQRFSTIDEKQFANNKNSTKGRSMMDFSSLTYEDSGNRHESWRKAKKFISAFSPKSQQDLNRNGRNGSTSSTKKIIKKSSSTSALHYDNSLKNPSTLAATSSMSELDELPPSLNIAVSNPNTMMIFREHKESEEIPSGLVRVREESSLKARGGVNIVLARRLQSGVNGSYSKYDGERITHQYTQNSAGNDVMSKFARKMTEPEVKFDSGEASDAIECAISRERDKLKQSDRRASSISFQKNHQVNVHHLNNVFKEALRAQNAIQTSSHSETASQLSSTESLSSDARSKISIKKRSNSPPNLIAPIILPRQASQRTLLQKQSSSSTDSLNSQKTTRTNVSIRLPMRVTANNSSSNENSSEESCSGTNNKSSNIFEQQVEHQLKHKSLSRQSSRRMSEGQGSNLSSEMTPARKGYFKKNSKMRRSHRTLNEAQYQT